MLMSYDEVKKEIEGVPITWLPGLLRAIVETAKTNGVFVPGGLVRFVTRVVDNAPEPDFNIPAVLASLEKAIPYLPDHVDGEFNSALSAVKRLLGSEK